jgi:hypothetical protein
MDTSYGNNSKLRQDLTGLGLSYVAAIQSTTKVRLVREDDPKPPRVSVEKLALSLPKRAWRTVTWREGTNVKLRSRFARVRVRAAPILGEARFDEETLLVEWPEGGHRIAGDGSLGRTTDDQRSRPGGCIETSAARVLIFGPWVASLLVWSTSPWAVCLAHSSLQNTS